MKIQLLFSHQELRASLEALMPLTINLKPGQEDSRRWLRVSNPHDLEFFDHQDGVSLSVHATLNWPLPLLPDSYDLKTIDARLYPSIENTPDGAKLAFDFKLEKLDIELLPDVLDELAVRHINKRLEQQRTQVAWNYSHGLSLHLGAPEWLESVSGLDILVNDGQFRVTRDAISITLDIAMLWNTPELRQAAARSAGLVVPGPASQELLTSTDGRSEQLLDEPIKMSDQPTPPPPGYDRAKEPRRPRAAEVAAAPPAPAPTRVTTPPTPTPAPTPATAVSTSEPVTALVTAPPAPVPASSASTPRQARPASPGAAGVSPPAPSSHGPGLFADEEAIFSDEEYPPTRLVSS